MKTKITFKEAQRRYISAFVPVMIFYAAACFAVPALLDLLGDPAPRWARVLAAVVTAAPIAVVLWLIARVLAETDEYTRKIQADAMLAGGAITIGLATLWGFAELYDAVPRLRYLPATMLVGPTFFGAWGLAWVVQGLRRG